MLIDGLHPFANVEACRPANIRKAALLRFALRSEEIRLVICRNEEEAGLKDMVVNDEERFDRESIPISVQSAFLSCKVSQHRPITVDDTKGDHVHIFL